MEAAPPTTSGDNGAAAGLFADPGLVFGLTLGATPSFEWAAVQAVGTLLVPARQWSGLWRAAASILEQLAHRHPPLGEWAAQVHAEVVQDVSFDPFGAGVRALARALRMPDYPQRITLRGDLVTWYNACPYSDFGRVSMALTAEWLRWAEGTRHSGEIAIAPAAFKAWRLAFDRLAGMLPREADLELHHRLWRRGVGWRWLGGTRTRVGYGARQRVVDDTNRAAALDEVELRLPIYTVTGSIGKTTTARLLWQLLSSTCEQVALAASDGAWIGERQVAQGDCIGGKAALALLGDPRTEAAVLEQGRGGIIKQGIPYAGSDIGILLNVHPVHLDIDGVETIEAMAEVKAVGVRPARIAVLNFDDVLCRRIGEKRAPQSCVWFSNLADSTALASLSQRALGALGVARAPDGSPEAITVWTGGLLQQRLGLAGVAPYHGLLGEKTVEELLAVCAAGWFGPLPIEDWPARLRALRLDADNHAFRTSVHRDGRVIYVLDKSAEEASMIEVGRALEAIAEREGTVRTLAVLARSAGEQPGVHLACIRTLYGFVDEIVCFDRPVSYTLPTALPLYAPGSIPEMLKDEIGRLNAAHGLDKPVNVAANWTDAEAFLRARLAELEGRVLVLINQPSTASSGLNRRIAAFTRGLSLPPGDEPE